MNIKNSILIGISSYLFFLLTLTPASTVISFLQLPSRTITLGGISGSIWSGSIDTVNFNNQKLQNLSWSLNPLSLITANVSSELETSFNGSTITTDLDYSLISNQVSLFDTLSSIRASELQKKLNLPFGELEGDIKLNFDEIQILPGKLPLVNGQVSWSNAKLTLSETISFGNITLKLEPGDKGSVSGKLQNVGGELSINGDIAITSDKKYTLMARFKPRANASKELQSIISLIAPKKEKSEHIIRRSGHLRDLGIKL